MDFWIALSLMTATAISLAVGYNVGRKESNDIWRTKYDTLYDEYRYMEDRCQDFSQDYFDAWKKHQKETAEYQNKLEAADETRSFLEEQLASAEAELALFRKKAHRK